MLLSVAVTILEALTLLDELRLRRKFAAPCGVRGVLPSIDSSIVASVGVDGNGDVKTGGGEGEEYPICCKRAITAFSTRACTAAWLIIASE